MALGTEIVVAASAGTCFGVERALELVSAAAKEHPGRVRTMGPLIHNPRVVDELAQQGVSAVNGPEEAQGLVLVLRSHGVTPDEEHRARELCSEVIDATCPFVKRVHREVERFAAEGRTVIVAGEAKHPEVRATCAHTEGAQALGSADEARFVVGKRVGVVAQTTLEHALLDEIVAALRQNGNDVDVRNTICAATSERQAAAAELADRSDVMLVIGGRSSANTRHLVDICAERCTQTHHIESAEEVARTWLEGAHLIGITAGASTPKAHIDEVVARCKELLANPYE